MRPHLVLQGDERGKEGGREGAVGGGGEKREREGHNRERSERRESRVSKCTCIKRAAAIIASVSCNWVGPSYQAAPSLTPSHACTARAHCQPAASIARVSNKTV